MPINLDALKPVLERLLDGRDDAADVIDEVTGLNVDDDRITREEHEAALKSADTAWSDRYKATFFAPPTESTTDVVDAGENTTDEDDAAEAPSLDDIFNEEN